MAFHCYRSIYKGGSTIRESEGLTIQFQDYFSAAGVFLVFLFPWVRLSLAVDLGWWFGCSLEPFFDQRKNAKTLINLKNHQWNYLKQKTQTSRRTFFRACVFIIFLPHIWNGFIFFCGFYNVFLVPCIVLVSEMLSFTMVTKFNYFLIWKLHRIVLYEVVSKASRGSLLQQWFIRFLVFFQSNVFRKRIFLNAANAFTDPHFFFDIA